jgi:hypothetical protein
MGLDLTPVVIPQPIVSIYNIRKENANNLTIPVGYNNDIEIEIKYPHGYTEFENLVLEKKVRLQLIHWDTNTKSKNTIGDRYKKTNTPRYVIHRNGSDDSGDMFFGSRQIDNLGNVYPDINSMKIIDSSTKPLNSIFFTLECSKFYGNGDAVNCGEIGNRFPFTYQNIINEPYIFQIRGEGRKTNFIWTNKPFIPKLTKYFAFVFMFKNKNGKWETGPNSKQIKLFIDTININDGNGNIEKYWYRFNTNIV